MVQMLLSFPLAYAIRCLVFGVRSMGVLDGACPFIVLGTLRYVTLRYVTLRYGTLRYGTVRYGTVRYGTVRYGTLRYVNIFTTNVGIIVG